MNGMVSGIGVWMVHGLAQAGPGDHIRVGDVVVVPDVDIGAEYRTNVYRNEAAGVPAANIRVAPGLSATLEGEDHGFRANGEWGLRKFFYVGEPELLSSETQSRVGNLDRFNEFNLGAGIDVFKRSVVGLRLDDSMALQNWTADAEYADLPYSSQYRNALSGGIRLNPGPALEFVAGGSWIYDSYQVPRLGESGERALNHRNSYGPDLSARWAFLPRTSLVMSGSYTLYDWQNNVLESNGSDAGSELGLPNSDSLKLWAGIDGRFTEKLFLEFMVGYGTASYDAESVTLSEPTEDIALSATGLRRLLVNSQVRFDLTPSTERRPGTKLSAGYIRDVRDSFFTNYVGLDQVFVKYDGRIGGLQPIAKYEVRIENYQGEIIRSDIVNRFSGDLAYWFQSYASASVGMWWQQRASNVNNVEYDDINVHVQATFSY